LRTLARRFALVLGMVLPALVAALVLGIGESSKRGLLDGTAVVAAVSLSPVVATADVERSSAAAAAQLEQQYVVHPARKDENWTTASGSGTVTPYRLSIRWPYTRVQLLTGPSFVSSAARTYSTRPGRANSWQLPDEDHLVPWAPVILVKMAPMEAGGDRLVPKLKVASSNLVSRSILMRR
jgi:hypothetical protein